MVFYAGDTLTGVWEPEESDDFDTSLYRQNTYGPPDRYCDPCKSRSDNSGGGTSESDTWNVDQAKANATAGMVVGFLPVGSGTPVDLAAPISTHVPAFNPTNSGTGTADSNRIIFVTKYAASAIVADVGKVAVETDTRRTELRHAGAPATIAADGQGGGESDTGGAIIGANARNYITYDGFYFDMEHCEIKEDSGVIATQDCTGITIKNFAIKGKTVGVASNCVLYRPGDTVDDVLSNFYVWGFHNNATANGNPSNAPQPALFSDQYGSRNFLIEYFDIDDCDRGIFCKGQSSFDQPDELNYGTIQYGRVTDTSYPVAFNAMDPTHITYVRYCLFYGTNEQTSQPGNPVQFGGDGINFDTISEAQQRNVEFDHITMAKVTNAPSTSAAFYVDNPNGLSAEPNGVKLTNSILDVDSGPFVFLIYLHTAEDFEEANRNYYCKNGSSIIFSRNGATLTFAQWQAATGQDANSVASNTSPFVDRANNDFNVTGAALTLADDGGQVGCFALGPSQTIGVKGSY
jgi:hypothetical protein